MPVQARLGGVDPFAEAQDHALLVRLDTVCAGRQPDESDDREDDEEPPSAGHPAAGEEALETVLTLADEVLEIGRPGAAAATAAAVPRTAAVAAATAARAAAAPWAAAAATFVFPGHVRCSCNVCRASSFIGPREALSDILQMTSKFVEIVPPSHRQENCIPFAAIRWHDFGNRPALGRPFGHFSRHPDTPLVSLSPRRRFPRPTPERVFVAIHRSAAGFPETGSGARRLRPIGT